MSDNQGTLTLDDVRSGFAAGIDRARLSWTYRAGLLVVALTMVVLPLCYVGIVLLAAWVVRWHLIANTWLLSGRGGGIWRLLAYLGPAAAGAIVVFFLLKPLFARPSRDGRPLMLNPEDEPVLFAFIERVCDLVGAPRPRRVEVDCRINASASFDGGLRGLMTRRLVLTIGIPLAAGLTVRQLAGVLAHELGHFAQGAGMTMTYIIRSVNAWFGRVVYARDRWDERLETWSDGADWRLRIVLLLARGGVWTSRKILYGLMLAGHAISSFMLRQMEFDADYYEAAVAGSPSFAATMQRLRELSAASGRGYEDIARNCRRGRLPEDFSALVVARAATLPAALKQALERAGTQPRSSVFDTHPSDAERVERASSLGSDGIVRLEGAAESMFTDFAGLSQRVTRHHYALDLGLDVDSFQIVDSSAVVADAAVADGADAARQMFFQDVPLTNCPIDLPDGPPGSPSLAEAVSRLAGLRAATVEQAARARQASGELEGAETNARLADTALVLLGAGMTILPAEFNLKTGTASEAADAARRAVAIQKNCSRTIEGFMQTASERLALVLWLVDAGADAGSPAADSHESERLRTCLRSLVSAWPSLMDLHATQAAWAVLLAIVPAVPENASSVTPGPLALRAAHAAARLREGLETIATTLASTPYPFPHAKGTLSVAAYLAGEDRAASTDADLQRVLSERFDRFWALYYEVAGRLALIALRAEAHVLSNDARPAEA